MSVDAGVDSSVDLFGKSVTDLQSGVAISGNAISGTLNYISDYSGFSSKTEEQSGNYLVIHAASDVEGATISVKVTNPVTLDDDGIAVLRIADKSSQTVTVVASKTGYKSNTKVFSLAGLECLSA